MRGRGPRQVITDLGIMAPDPDSCELTLTHVHPGVTVEQVIAATGWELGDAADLRVTEAPTEHEVAVLRHLVQTKRQPVTRTSVRP